VSYTYTFEDIRHRPVAVIGAGTLGRRIALMFASRGGTVRIHARRAEQLTSATQYVKETLPKLLAERGFGEVGVVTATGSLEEALDGAWLAVESVPEKLEIKNSAVGPDRPSGAVGHNLRDQLVVVPVTSDGRKRARQNTFVQHAFLHATAVQRSGPDVGR
jgi:NAD(P)-dependent dehydrogenase (short-subunit alcohol dehydrogenase family)